MKKDLGTCVFFFFAILQWFSVCYYIECAKLHVSRSFVPYVPHVLYVPYVPYVLRCYTCLRVCFLRAFFFYVPYAPSFITCPTCLHFLRALRAVRFFMCLAYLYFFMCHHFCTCITCLHFFKCFTCFRIFTCLACRHFSLALQAFIFYMLIKLTQINEILFGFIKYFYSYKTRVISCVCTFFETENFD